MRIPLVHAAALALLCPLVSAQEIKLLPSDGAWLDHFGHSVAISGTTAIVGAQYGDDNGADSGSAYLFDTTTGTQIAKLLPNDGAPYDSFGYSVAISGTTAIVGALHGDDNGSSSGSAYLFDTTTGTQLLKLLPSDGAADDWFGYSVAVSGATAIVGANRDDDNGLGSGSAYLFDTTTGTQLFKLLPRDGAADDWFGHSVAISGTTAIVGAHWDDDNGSTSGSAYLFDTTTGIQIAKLLPSDGATFDIFGVSVAISGATAIVGAPFDDDNGFNSGSAYLFDITTGTQIAKLLASDGASDDYFGWSVGISGNTAVVGASEDDDNGLESGSAYLFDAATGVQIAKLLPSDGAADDWFGYSVAITGSTAIVGANGDDDNGLWSGSAYLLGFFDCNGNGIDDLQDIATGTSSDCDNDHVPDECQIASGQETDCDNDGVIDACQHTEDCDLSGTLDVCDIATGAASDTNGNGIIDSCECLASSYCIASPNSVSVTGAPISLDGLPSVSANNMTLRAENLRPNQFGVFFYGPVEQDPPVSFGDGYRCVGTFGLTRLNPPVPTGTGTAQRPLDMTSSPLNSIQAGDTRYFQFWYRDPVSVGANYNLTNGLEITFCP